MKFNSQTSNLAKYSLRLLILSCLITTMFSVRFSLSKSEGEAADIAASAETTPKPEDDISDKDLELLLKDPKYASLAGDMMKSTGTASSSSSKLDDLAALKEMDLDAKNAGLDTKHKSSKSKLDFKLGKDDPLAKIDFLSKTLGSSDPLKDLDLLSGLPDRKPAEKKKDKKKEEDEEKFKHFDFMTKQQARYLIEVLKQPAFFSMLPMEAQQIVNTVNDSFSFKYAQNDKINDFIDISMTNTPTSQTFIDPDGTIARKGILTLIDPETGNSKFVWTISNAKVLCFFQSQSLLTIVKLFRNSSLLIKDVNSTPCFLMTSFKDPKDGSVMACATSTQEKEVWTQTIKSHLMNRS